jgi:hypothetical protein
MEARAKSGGKSQLPKWIWANEVSEEF